MVFLYPPDPGVIYAKRVIAVGGNTIEIRDQHVYVDGRELDEPYVAPKTILPPDTNTCADRCRRRPTSRR